MPGYGNWGKHIELFSIWESANEDPNAMRALVGGDDSLLEGTGAIEGRADFPIFLQTVIRHRMRERFRAIAARWQQYVGFENAQDFREHTVSQLNGIRGIRGINEDGEYPRLRTSEEEGPSFAVGKHGGTYAVTMELVINDETDKILNRTPRELGRSMAEYQAQVVTAFIESNPTYGPDGQPFFGVAHSNEVTGAPAAPNETNLLAGLDLMRLRRDPDGIPFAVEPRRIIVRTPSQKATFDRIIRSQLTGVMDTATTNANLGYGQFFTGNYNPAYNVLPPDAVVDDPWLNDPNDYYLLGNAEDRPPFVAAYLRNRREPFIGIKDQGARDAMGAGSDPYSWWFDSVDYKVRHFFGVAPGEPLAAVRFRP